MQCTKCVSNIKKSVNLQNFVSMQTYSIKIKNEKNFFFFEYVEHIEHFFFYKMHLISFIEQFVTISLIRPVVSYGRSARILKLIWNFLQISA